MRFPRPKFMNGRSADTYFHGGVSGLKPGDFIESPANNQRAMEYRTVVDRGKAKVGQPYVSESGKVYVTTDLGYARVYADRRRGDVYEVGPIGEIENDPDHSQNCFQASSAQVFKVVERQVDLSVLEALKLRAPYMSFYPGIPLYDDDGYINETPTLRADGWTGAELRRTFGKWPDPSEIFVASRTKGVREGLYDQDGWLLPAASMAKRGVLAVDLREFGQWANPREAMGKIRQIIEERRGQIPKQGASFFR